MDGESEKIRRQFQPLKFMYREHGVNSGSRPLFHAAAQMPEDGRKNSMCTTF
jgi:hypothetical protein